MARKRIGILTGGGDVPGLNSVIKTVTYRSSENDIDVIGLRRGWEALTHLNVDDAESRRRYVMPLDRENTRIIDRRGGTVLHSSRTNPAKITKLPDHLAGKDFPLSQGKGGATNTWDLSEQVMANLSALKRAYRDILIGGRPDVRLVYLKGDRDLIARRLAARDAHFMPPALLDSQFASLEEPLPDEHAIVVSIVPHPRGIVEEIVKRLGKAAAPSAQGLAATAGRSSPEESGNVP